MPLQNTSCAVSLLSFVWGPQASLAAQAAAADTAARLWSERLGWLKKQIQRKSRAVLAAGGLLAASGLLSAGGAAAQAQSSSPLLEISTAQGKFQGKEFQKFSKSIWLMQQDGRLRHLKNEEIVKTTQLQSQFRGWSLPIIRDQVRRELGTKFSAAGTRHYIVLAREERTAKKYAELFEDVYNNFYHYFSVRSVRVRDPEFALVAVVFPTRDEYVKYAAGDGVKASPQMRGYYLSTSNRVALYEQDSKTTGISHTPHSVDDLWASINADLQDTIVHEATHQVAFNTGLHVRLGANPKWVVEGLATVFESPGIRISSSGGAANSRINRDRFMWFGNYLKERRKPKSLAAFLGSDKLFDTNALDAYAEAWALSFYLVETRSRDYAKYLALLAKRDSRVDYTETQRLADFQAVFGRETPLLEAQFIRYISSLK